MKLGIVVHIKYAQMTSLNMPRQYTYPCKFFIFIYFFSQFERLVIELNRIVFFWGIRKISNASHGSVRATNNRTEYMRLYDYIYCAFKSLTVRRYINKDE